MMLFGGALEGALVGAVVGGVVGLVIALVKKARSKGDGGENKDA